MSTRKAAEARTCCPILRATLDMDRVFFWWRFVGCMETGGAGVDVGLAADRWLGPVWVDWYESGLWGRRSDVGLWEMRCAWEDVLDGMEDGMLEK
jgi:hypothetical protein